MEDTIPGREYFIQIKDAFGGLLASSRILDTSMCLVIGIVDVVALGGGDAGGRGGGHNGAAPAGGRAVSIADLPVGCVINPVVVIVVLVVGTIVVFLVVDVKFLLNFNFPKAVLVPPIQGFEPHPPTRMSPFLPRRPQSQVFTR